MNIRVHRFIRLPSDITLYSYSEYLINPDNDPTGQLAMYPMDQQTCYTVLMP